MMKASHVTTLAILLPLSVCVTGESVFANDLDVSASTPDVTVPTRPAGRRSIRLPSLEYTFTVEATCRADLAPAALSLSIADTRIAMSADELGADSPVKISITIPASQIAPLTIERFCVRSDTEEPVDNLATVRIAAVLSAQASLLCSNDDSNEMTYASESLDVRITCEEPAGQEEMVSIR
jgi:hypothetical protein